MSTESKRALIAVGRKAVMAGLILLVIWVILLALRHSIPSVIVDRMNAGLKTPVSHDSSTWDWNKSLWTGHPVSQDISPRVSLTMQLIGLTGLFSLIVAGIALSLGVFIRRFTEKPHWLARVRSTLRLVLVSSSSSVLILTIGPLSVGMMVLFHIYGWSWWLPDNSSALIYLAALYACILPAGLLIQAGHGEIVKWPETTPSPALAYDLGVKSVIRLLRLTGVIIVMTLEIGLGNLLIQSAITSDFPVVFSLIWIFVLIIVIAKLAANLIEIAYNYARKTAPSTEPVRMESPLRFAVPNGWLIFCEVLVVLLVLVAIIGPLLAPYGKNEIHLIDRLSPPSAKYLLGTDQLGRDIFSRLLYGISIDVLTGLACAAVVSIVAAGWGMLAAYCRRMNNWIGDTLEDLVMLPREIACALPWLALILLIMCLWQNSSIVMVGVVCGLVMLPRAAGMVQEAYLSAPNGKDWVQGVLWSLPMVFLFATAGVIIYFSAISYLGLGVPPGVPELGSMLSNEGRQYLFAAPALGLWPAFCLAFSIFTFVMTGDVLLEKMGFRSKAVWSKTME
jgi:ABC-type dipeptide/oligopeptide/nickel transport system permease subunit